ncbi:MAG: RsmD family RNA methyltransferase [Spirochaetales bacterium]|nr:RsmD family RNA methyltransferase [Spirochaetales bacterium]
MRVTGGIYKGRNVACPPGVIRPAMDRMRESLFAILGSLEGLSFLDLYAGSGIVGIEAASRGAAEVVFVEKDPRKRSVLRRNVAFLTQPVELCFVPVERYVRSVRRCFDLIFLDPPYNQPGTLEVLTAISSRGLLQSAGSSRSAGTLITHMPKEELPPERVGSLVLQDRRVYGRAVLSFYRTT